MIHGVKSGAPVNTLPVAIRSKHGRPGLPLPPRDALMPALAQAERKDIPIPSATCPRESVLQL